MQDYRKLRVWVSAHELTLQIYRATAGFPSHERYGLRSQLRRSMASIGMNLAEGCGRSTDAAFAAFVESAMASSCDADYQLLLARGLGYLTPAAHERLAASLTRTRRMLFALARRLRRRGRVAGPRPTPPAREARSAAT